MTAAAGSDDSSADRVGGARAGGQDPSAARQVEVPSDSGAWGGIVDGPQGDQPGGSAESVVLLDSAARNAEFSLFYRVEQPRLVAFVVYQGASVQQAADIAQDAMLKAYQQWNELDNPRAWVRLVARRAWWKVAGRARDEASVGDPDELGTPGGLVVSDHAEAIVNGHGFVSLVRRLPARQREVMAWTYDGYRPTEIAGMLGLEPATVRSALREARAALNGEGGDIR